MQNTNTTQQYVEMIPIKTTHMKVKSISDLEGSGINFTQITNKAPEKFHSINPMLPRDLKVRTHNGRVEEALLLDIEKISIELEEKQKTLKDLYLKFLDGSIETTDYYQMKDAVEDESGRLRREQTDLVLEYNELWGTR